MDSTRDILGYAALVPGYGRDAMGYYYGPSDLAELSVPPNYPPLDGVSAQLSHTEPAQCLWQRVIFDTMAQAPMVHYNKLGDVPPELGAVPFAHSQYVAQDAPMLFYSTPPETSILIQYVSGPNYDERLLTATAPQLSYGALPGLK